MSKIKYQKLPHTDTSKSPNIRTKIHDNKEVKKQSSVLILLKKISGYFLVEIAYFAPLNSVRVWCHRTRGVKIGENVFIGLHVILDRVYPEYISLEDECGIAGGNHIITHSRPPKRMEASLASYAAEVVIKKGAWLGINSVVLPGVEIGEESVVTAGSVVTSRVPDRVIVRGNPAKIVVHL